MKIDSTKAGSNSSRRKVEHEGEIEGFGFSPWLRRVSASLTSNGRRVTLEFTLDEAARLSATLDEYRHKYPAAFAEDN